MQKIKRVIKININNIHDDFVKRYSGKADALRTFAVCSDITIVGNGFEESTEEYYSLPLSIRTYLSVRESDKNSFDFQMSDSDEEYSSQSQDLMKYKGKDFEGDIFKAIAHTKGKCKGAELLFSFDAESEPFMDYIPAVYVAFGQINDGKNAKMAEAENMYKSVNHTADIECQLSGRKNYLISSDINSAKKYIPFNMSGYKVIIVTSNLKKEKPERKLTPYIEKVSSMSHSRSYNGENMQNVYEKYVANEINRRQKIGEILGEKGAFGEEIFSLLWTSAYEYCNILDKNSDVLKRMLNAAQQSGLCDFAIPVLKYRGIAFFVRDELVDEFVNFYSQKGEQESGSQVKFYIADSENSGVEVYAKNDKKN